MGRNAQRKRKRKEELKLAQTVLSNPLTRKVATVASRKGVVKELSKGTVSAQTGRLDELVGTGTLPKSRLRDAIARKAPKEMDKAIRKFRKEGREVTVDSLLVEVRSTPGFLRMCEGVGLDYKWFERLAKEQMEANGL